MYKSTPLTLTSFLPTRKMLKNSQNDEDTHCWLKALGIRFLWKKTLPESEASWTQECCLLNRLWGVVLWKQARCLAQLHLQKLTKLYLAEHNHMGRRCDMTGEEAERCKCFKELQKNCKRDEVTICSISISILDIYTSWFLSIRERNKLVKHIASRSISFKRSWLAAGPLYTAPCHKMFI